MPELFTCESCGKDVPIKRNDKGDIIKEECPECCFDNVPPEKLYTLTTTDPLAIPVSTAELQSALDTLLDIAEEYYPAYSSDDEVLDALDFYKRHLG